MLDFDSSLHPVFRVRGGATGAVLTDVADGMAKTGLSVSSSNLGSSGVAFCPALLPSRGMNCCK